MRRGNQPKKELYSGMNRTGRPPHHDYRGPVGSFHISDHCGSSSYPAHYDPLSSHAQGLFSTEQAPQLGPWEVVPLKAWRDRM
jgi:hypothetical protein